MSLKPRNVNFEEAWSILQETVKSVLTLQHIPRLIWNDRFSDVYALCVSHPNPHAETLYKETKELLEMHVRDMQARVRQQGKQENVGLLMAYHAAWLEYSKGVVYLNQLYSYMNTHYVKRQRKAELSLDLEKTPDVLNEIHDLGLETWKDFMVEPLREELVALLLDNIKQDRLGNPNLSLSDVIHDVIQSFVEVNVGVDYRRRKHTEYYEEVFEKPFLEATGEFYQREAAKLMQECTISQYLEKVQLKLKEESIRARKYIHASSYSKAKDKCMQYFVVNYLTVLHAECEHMVREERLSDLKNIYPLMRPIQNGLSPIAELYIAHVRTQGLNAVNNLQGDNVHMQFVENLLDVYYKYSKIVEEVFLTDPALVSAMDKACAQVINHRPNPKLPSRSPELLAKYCDTLLKKSSKGVSESDIEDKLTKSIILFRYIDDKDVYQKFYSKMLARRLIHQQSQGMDAEEAMINKLKQSCGFEFTNKLLRMYTDISLSADINAKFQDYLKSKAVDLAINFQINVLQAGAWPLSQGPSSFIVPHELVKSMQHFEQFYKQSFNGRRLTWYQHLCQGELKLSYLPKTYIISMQTFQMAILLLFEQTDEMTGQDIEQGVGLSSEYLQKQLQSLVDAKLLLDNGIEFSPTTVYSLNLQYLSKRTRFKISGAQQRETPQEVQTTIAGVEEDRKLVLQATIVRIMKSRKVLKHNALLQELLSQKGATFQPSVSMIKKCIEALIDKQYIERTPNSQDEYSYVA